MFPQENVKRLLSLTFSSHPDSALVSAYTGSATVPGYAYYDANGNGYIDNFFGATSVPFPGFPTSFGTVQNGCGYANAYGTQANIVVVAELGDGKKVVVHFRVANDVITPVQALVGNFTNGPVLIQDASLTHAGLYGHLPDQNNNDYFHGEMILTPFCYDDNLNVIYGNELSSQTATYKNKSGHSMRAIVTNCKPA